MSGGWHMIKQTLKTTCIEGIPDCSNQFCLACNSRMVNESALIAEILHIITR